MASSGTRIFDGMLVDHVEFYVNDIAAKADWFVNSFGFTVYAATDASDRTAEVHSVGLGKNQIRLVLTEPQVADHPSAVYVDRHGDGVANLGLRVADAAAAFDEAVRRGARPLSPPVRHGDVVTAAVMGFGDVAHTFVQRAVGTDERTLPGLRPVPVADPGPDNGLGEVDHFAVCVESGQIDSTVEFYRRVLDFELIFTEHIVIGSQAMTTKVVQSESGAVTLTLIEPDVSQVPGHIDEFLEHHGGAGVQHMAFTTGNIVEAVDAIGARGVEFLSTPDAYYSLLPQRVELGRYSVDALQRLNILVDEDHDGQLYQIFAKSVHSRNTFFLELIERLGARSFGSGNMAALYQAVELQRSREEIH
ncbi:4-hydroxyphenylpyruvate dioxygenase [Streptosporangium sp. CA-135522]|uniref:4-hydroxyphenylpyruvate dioxygenase n=1 Tax=Streptosporangium sp. CA-135522 TaxID=3240072 RepID=UPI003D93EE8C